MKIRLYPSQWTCWTLNYSLISLKQPLISTNIFPFHNTGCWFTLAEQLVYSFRRPILLAPDALGYMVVEIKIYAFMFKCFMILMHLYLIATISKCEFTAVMVNCRNQLSEDGRQQDGFCTCRKSCFLQMPDAVLSCKWSICRKFLHPWLVWHDKWLDYNALKTKQFPLTTAWKCVPGNPVHRESNTAATDLFLMTWRFILNSLPEITQNQMA